MKRGEIWTIAGGGDFVGKPRPVIILQDDRFEELDSVTICPLTTNETDAFLLRTILEPTPSNGLGVRSRTMADKITTVRRTRLRERIGEIEANEMAQLGRGVLLFLGFAGDARAQDVEGEPRQGGG